jgi:hypothetical protein
VREAFRRLGHDAWSIDLLPADDESPYHIKGDILSYLANSREKFDLMVAHPPCTYLCLSGVRWLYKGGKGKIRDEARWKQMREGADFFAALLHADIPKICIENPIMHGYAKDLIGEGPTQIVQPWWFGDNERKSTGLWLKGLPPLKATHEKPVEIGDSVHMASPGPDRWKIRSTTFPGLAREIARQWG